MNVKNRSKRIYCFVVLLLLAILSIGTVVLAEEGALFSSSYCFTIRKILAENSPEAAKDREYTFRVEGYATNGDHQKIERTVTVKGNESKTIDLGTPTKITVVELTDNVEINDNNGQYNMTTTSCESHMTVPSRTAEIAISKNDGKIKIERPDDALATTYFQVTGTTFKDSEKIEHPQCSVPLEVAPGSEITLSGLPRGDYKIEELKAQEGFTVKVGPRDVSVSADQPSAAPASAPLPEALQALGLARESQQPDGHMKGIFHINGKSGKVTITAPQGHGNGEIYYYYLEKTEGEYFKPEILAVNPGEEYTRDHLTPGTYVVTEYIHGGSSEFNVTVPQKTETTLDTKYITHDATGKKINTYYRYTLSKPYPTYYQLKLGNIKGLEKGTPVKVQLKGYWYNGNDQDPVEKAVNFSLKAGYTTTINSSWLLCPGPEKLLRVALFDSDVAGLKITLIPVKITWKEKTSTCSDADVSYTRTVDERGWMKIGKPEDSSEGADNVKYYYTVTDENNQLITNYTVVDQNGNAVSATDRDGTTLMLKAGQTVTLNGLAAGSYNIIETIQQDTPEPFHLKIVGDEKDTTTANEEFNITIFGERDVTISKRRTDQEPAARSGRSVNSTEDSANSVTEVNDGGRDYKFQIYVVGNGADGPTETEYGDPIILKANEETTRRLPEGKYKIKAIDDKDSGYDLTFNDSSTILVSTRNSGADLPTVTFTNTFMEDLGGSYRVIHEYYLKNDDNSYTYEGSSGINTVHTLPLNNQKYTSENVRQEPIHDGHEYIYMARAYGNVSVEDQENVPANALDDPGPDITPDQEQRDDSEPDDNEDSVSGNDTKPDDDSDPDDKTNPDDDSDPDDQTKPDDDSDPGDKTKPDDDSDPDDQTKPGDDSDPDDKTTPDDDSDSDDTASSENDTGADSNTNPNDGADSGDISTPDDNSGTDVDPASMKDLSPGDNTANASMKSTRFDTAASLRENTTTYARNVSYINPVSVAGPRDFVRSSESTVSNEITDTDTDADPGDGNKPDNNNADDGSVSNDNGNTEDGSEPDGGSADDNSASDDGDERKDTEDGSKPDDAKTDEDSVSDNEISEDSVSDNDIGTENSSEPNGPAADTQKSKALNPGKSANAAEKTIEYDGNGIISVGTGTDTDKKQHSYQPSASMTDGVIATEDGSQIIIMRYYREIPKVVQGSYKVIHVYYLRDHNGDTWEGNSNLITCDVGELTDSNRAQTYTADGVEKIYTPQNFTVDGTHYTYEYDGPAYGIVSKSNNTSDFTGEGNAGEGWRYAPDTKMTQVYATEAGDQIIILRYYRKVESSAPVLTGSYNVVHEYYSRTKDEPQSSEAEDDIAPAIEINSRPAGLIDLGNIIGTTFDADSSPFTGTLVPDDSYTYTFEGVTNIERISAPLESHHTKEDVAEKPTYTPAGGSETQYKYHNIGYGFKIDNDSYECIVDKQWASAKENGEDIIILRYVREVDTPPEPEEPEKPDEPDKPDKPDKPGKPDKPTKPTNPDGSKSPDDQLLVEGNEPGTSIDPPKPAVPSQPKAPGSDNSKFTELPDPNDPSSPDTVTVWKDGVPQVYSKVWNAGQNKWEYLPSENGSAVKTGDENHTGIWLMLTIAALGGLVALHLTRKRQERSTPGNENQIP